MDPRTLIDMLFSPPSPKTAGFSEAEVMNFLFGILGGAVLLSFRRRGRLPRLRFFYPAYAFLMVAYGATILEGFAWWGFFNLVEHAFLALSGVGFALAVLVLSRRLPAGEEGREEGG